VRVEIDPDPPPQPFHQVIDGRIGQRVAFRLGEQVHEHVVGIQIPILAVQVVRVKPHQRRGHRDRSRHGGLRPGPIVVVPENDRDLPLGGLDVLVPQPERLTDPEAAVMQDGEQQPVT
jgi:hypothetical protein